MPHVFTHSEYADMVFVYGFCGGNALSARREYVRRFPNRRIPNCRVFTYVFNKLHLTGTVPSTRIAYERANVQNLNEIEGILQLVEHSPSTSTRRISTRIGVPQATVWRTLHFHGLYPFHLQRVQHLHPGDEARRLEFCRWVIANRRVIPSILFTDEANFTRDGINNSRNSHRWSEENPHATVETNYQHRFSVNVWCGVIDNHLIGPVILPNRLTGPIYLDFLQNQLQLLLDDVPLATRMVMHFQHDGAPAHSSRQVTDHLNETFPERWIGRYGRVHWPPRSPDLTPLDFCLWGWMKSEVYKERVNTREELVARIMNSAALINEQQDKLRRATQTYADRVRRCIEVGGGIFEHLL